METPEAPRSPSFLRRPAPRVVAAAAWGTFVTVVIFVFFPTALASQGITYESMPQWFQLFMGDGFPSLAGAAVFLASVIPKKSRRDERVLELELEVARLKANQPSSQPVTRVTEGEHEVAREKDLKKPPSAAERLDLLNQGKKLWEVR